MITSMTTTPTSSKKAFMWVICVVIWHTFLLVDVALVILCTMCALGRLQYPGAGCSREQKGMI